MQIFNIITNFFTIAGAIVGCAMFCFTYKNHQWLVEDRKKQIEQETRNKLNKIFSIVAECLIYQQHVNEKVPKEVIEFISNDINHNISFLRERKQAMISEERQQVELEKKNSMNQNINMMLSASACSDTEKRYDKYVQSRVDAIEQNFIVEQQKILNEIISQYRNGTRFNDMDFNKLRSYFKDNKQIEECYNEILISK